MIRFRYTVTAGNREHVTTDRDRLRDMVTKLRERYGSVELRAEMLQAPAPTGELDDLDDPLF